MPHFYIEFESNEDRFDGTENLEDAIRIAREVARKSPSAERICIAYNGMHIWEFVRMPDGKVRETKLQAA